MWYETRGSHLTFSHVYTRAYTHICTHTCVNTHTYTYMHTVHNPPAEECQRKSVTLRWHFHAWNWAVSARSSRGHIVSLELQNGARNCTLFAASFSWCPSSRQRISPSCVTKGFPADSTFSFDQPRSFSCRHLIVILQLLAVIFPCHIILVRPHQPSSLLHQNIKGLLGGSWLNSAALEHKF